MERNTFVNTYAYRVTEVHNKVTALLGEEKAQLFNEFIRGASLLENENNLLLREVESLNENELGLFVDDLKAKEKDFKKGFKVGSIYEVFQKVAEIGRTKLYIWKAGKYQEIMVSEDEKKLLPWAGKIQSGGPNEAVTGMVAIARDFDIVLGSTSITINGHVFSLS